MNYFVGTFCFINVLFYPNINSCANVVKRVTHCCKTVHINSSVWCRRWALCFNQHPCRETDMFPFHLREAVCCRNLPHVSLKIPLSVLLLAQKRHVEPTFTSEYLTAWISLSQGVKKKRQMASWRRHSPNMLPICPFLVKGLSSFLPQA